ncbi:unnamed protein product [Orchesella dallaii]|uniref:Uncharacterized protein n=1 Tax=Orchesella dallaii TaxID=48710 RepID=A0ABP1Q4T1_9HEXA
MEVRRNLVSNSRDGLGSFQSGYYYDDDDDEEDDDDMSAGNGSSATQYLVRSHVQVIALSSPFTNGQLI